MKRSLSYDILKLLAFFAVVTIHVCINYIHDIQTISLTNIFVTNLDCIVRFAVPVFLMVTGAIMLNENKKYDLKTYLIKYPLRMLLILIFWLIIHAVISFIIYGEAFTIKNFILKLINTYGIGAGSLWYLYCLIGAYLIIPVLKLFVKKSNSKYILYIIILNIIFQYLTNTFDGLIHFSSTSSTIIANKFRISFVSGVLNYLLIGWYLTSIKLKTKREKLIYITGLISLLLMMLIMDVNQDKAWEISAFIMSDTSILTLFYSSAIFLLIYNIFINKHSNNFISELTKISFGAYLVHEIINAFLFQYVFSKFVICNLIVLNVIASIIIVSITSLLISFILGKIPVLRYFIYKK